MSARIMSLVALVLLGAGPAQEDYFPPADPRAGGIRDLMLIYLQQDAWAQAEFLPYVAYLGKQSAKRPHDWFYDSFLFLAFGGAPSGTTYIVGTTNKTDWAYYFDRLLFRPDRSLAALDTCIRDVEQTLGPRPPVPVILMIPYPSRAQKDFGDLDGDGRSEDLSQPADRERAVRWGVDQMLRRWKQTHFSRLKLWGFYWMNEGIGPHDEAIVRATAAYVHRLGYGLHWIPYYRAPGCDKLATLGIDFAVLQPNYAFMEQNGRRPEEQRLSDAAGLARRCRMGIEIEMTALGARADRENLWDYLIHGRDEFDGYMRGAVHAYYQGRDTIARLCHSDVPADRDLYEALYQFAKGTFAGQRCRLTTSCSYRIVGPRMPEFPDNGRKLTDGRLVNDPTTADRLVGLAGTSSRIELDLGTLRRIAEVELRVATRGTLAIGLPAAAACPVYFDVATSTTGRDWQPAGRGYRWYATPSERITAGGLVAEFPAVDARFVALTVHQAAGKITLVDELLGESAPMLTDDALCQAASPAALEVTLRDPRHLGLVRVRSPQAAAIAWLDVLARLDGTRAWKPLGQATRRADLWDFDAGAAFAGQLRLVATPQAGKRATLDAVEVYPADSLARGKPYELWPAHPEKYGDPERRILTDAQVSERGFGDHRMVGWYFQNVEVSLDLGQSVTIDGARLHSQGGGYAAVEFPVRVDVLVSLDGRAWSWVGAIDRPPEKLLLDRATNHTRLQLGWMATHFAPVAARFVLFRATPRAWTMFSEMEVLAAGKNVAQGRPYHLRPAPASSAPYADATGRLTDGQYTSTGWGRAVGWNTERPRVVVDLGLPVSVSEVCAHVLGGGPGGVHFPTSLAVATSCDGVRWEAEQAVRACPPETGHDAAQATLRVLFPARPARYVRLEFTRRGWLMLDEVEVYGPGLSRQR